MTVPRIFWRLFFGRPHFQVRKNSQALSALATSFLNKLGLDFIIVQESVSLLCVIINFRDFVCLLGFSVVFFNHQICWRLQEGRCILNASLTLLMRQGNGIHPSPPPSHIGELTSHPCILQVQLEHLTAFDPSPQPTHTPLSPLAVILAFTAVLTKPWN